jgi:uncharacterized protein
MSLKEQLQADSNAALRAGDKPRLGAIRLALAAIKQQEVDTRTALDDAAVQAVLSKLIKKGRDAAEQFAAGGREDLAAKESGEIAVLQSYLPAQLDTAELKALVDRAIAATGAESAKDIGKVMGVVKREAAGRCDLAAASALIREALTGA